MAAILHLDIQRPWNGADDGCRKQPTFVEVSTD